MSVAAARIVATLLVGGGLLLLLASVAAADDDHAAAHDWLVKMSRSARGLDYTGVFVYQHGTQLEAMRIVHKGRGGAPRERLVSLNGTPREVIRNQREVICLLPDMKSVVVEYRRSGGKRFPVLLPEERLADLGEYYVIRLGGSGRVAGREAQIVLIHPRDDYRYGYQLWADRDSGLLLKADLLDRKGRILEQFMFTHLVIGEPIPDTAIEPQISDQEALHWYREEGDRMEPQADEPGWTAVRLPGGFRLSTFMKRREPIRRKPIEHLVYSDGLAAVSVFIEKSEENKPFMLGTRRMGAVHAFGRRIGGYQVTAVGEVPAATVVMIGSSMTPNK